MGRIFRPAQIENGLVPAEGAHLRAAELIRDQLLFDQAGFEMPGGEWEWPDNAVWAGMVHGSSVTGDANIRSDVDVLLLTREDPSKRVIRKVFSLAQQKYRVPIEPQVIGLREAEEGIHTLDPLFLCYLRHAKHNQSFSWHDPIDIIDTLRDETFETPKALAEVALSYTAQKTKQFANSLVMPRGTTNKVLQRAMELPKNLGRKLLTMLDNSFDALAAGGEEIAHGLKGFLITYFPEAQGIYDTSGLVDSLVSIDSHYTDLLLETISGAAHITEYSQWLREYRRDIIERAHLLSVLSSLAVKNYARSL